MKHVGVAIAALVGAVGVAQAQDAQKPKIDPLFLPYEQPGILARIANGQTVHIKCMGKGSPTVLMTSGLGGWAADWRTVQPQIAKTTRACAWDRPGMGFSSGTTRTQTSLERTEDLEDALKAARIAGPYILVGHSLGGYESLLFADRNLKSVAGMVLVDPSVPDQFDLFAKAAPHFAAFISQYQKGQSAVLQRCLDGVRSGKLKIGGKDPDGCLAYPPAYPRALEAKLVRIDTNPSRFAAALSTISQFPGDAKALVNPGRNYGDIPLIVLTAMKMQALPADVPAAAKAEIPAQQAAWSRAHDAIAALSMRGENRQVADATHYIQYDRPQVVIDAVNEVVAKVRAGR